jgi:hypothetical protein
MLKTSGAVRQLSVIALLSISSGNVVLIDSRDMIISTRYLLSGMQHANQENEI